MGEIIQDYLDPTKQASVSGNALTVLGSVAITNAHIDVDVTVADYVSVVASGAWIAISGQTTVTQTTDPWVVLGSVNVDNTVGILGSVNVDNTVGILGSVNVDNTVTVSGLTTVTQDTSPWIINGSVNVDNVVDNGSIVYQGTNPWITLGSVAITNVVPISGVVYSENIPYDSNEQLTFIAGSPTSDLAVFTSGLVKTLTIKCDEDTYVVIGSSTVDANSFLIYAGEAISSNFQAGSISHLAKATIGSIWAWGGR